MLIANSVNHFCLVYVMCFVFRWFRKFAVIVFIACLRFETAKRRLQYLDFSDFYECALAIMSYWTYTYQHSGPEYYDTEMDREFLLDLREIRGLLDKEKEIKQFVQPHYILLLYPLCKS